MDQDIDEKGVTDGDTTTSNRSDVEEEIRKGLKVEFEDQVEFYEEFGLTNSESESLARAGFFLVPFDITEERCKVVMNNMQAVRYFFFFSISSHTTSNNFTHINRIEIHLNYPNCYVPIERVSSEVMMVTVLSSRKICTMNFDVIFTRKERNKTTTTSLPHRHDNFSNLLQICILNIHQRRNTRQLLSL